MRLKMKLTKVQKYECQTHINNIQITIMKSHYLYIDDDPQSNNIIQGFENDNLSISIAQHQNSWKDQMHYLTENEGILDGLILDLKLDQFPNQNNIKANYRGTSIAQEIRTRQKEKVLKSFPIVLFSTKEEFDLAMEDSAKDVFDMCMDKSNLSVDLYTAYTSQLIALSEGYKMLSTNNKLESILNTDITLLDSRFVFEYNELKRSPVHVQTRFLITEFFERQGLLINEDVLAARLGVDKNNSKDWGILKQTLTPAKYEGVFSLGWERWWAHLVERWWNEAVTSEMSLRTTTADLRVRKIKERLGLSDVVPATKKGKAKSNEFWTICKGCGKPLDPVDGLLISGQDNLYSWQEPEYVSIDSALNKEGIQYWQNLAGVEKEHFEKFKVILSQRKDDEGVTS